MDQECKQCKVPEVLSGEISLSLREWTFIEKAKFWVLIYGKVTGWLASNLFLLSAFSVFAMMIPIVIDVVMRLTMDKSIPGVIEIEEILMLIIVFCGLAWAKFQGGHIRVDLLYDHFPQWIKTGLAFFHTSLMGTFTLLMTFFICEAALEKYHGGEFTPDLGMPLWPFFILAAIGSAVLCLCILKQTLDAFLEILENKQFGTMLLFMAMAIFVMISPWLVLNYTELYSNYSAVGGISILALMLVLLLRMPIGFAMGIVGLIGLIVILPAPMMALSTLSSTPTHTALNFIMTVVPMFVLMGELALYAGISGEMFNAASVWLGRLPGGIAVAGVAGCTGFAAICGDSLATAMTMTSVALPEMKKRNYNLGLGCASLAAGGTLGILIPPSLGFIMYAIVTEVSIGELFIAGIVPGLLLATAFCIMLIVMALKWPELAPRGDKHSFGEKIASLTGIIPMVFLIILIIGGILSGICSPTEGGAVGAAGTLLYALVRRRLSWHDFIHSLRSTAGITARLLMIFIGVNILGYFLATTQLPFRLAEWTLGIGSNRYVIFSAIVVMYIILGCLMNVVPMILLTLPAIFPTVQALGFDPVWFGVITVILMEMGQITPPMGVVVFAIAGMPGTPSMMQIFKYILPFVICMLLMVLIMTIFPEIVTFLPKLLISGV